jgi:hypothetical protein
MTPLEFAELVRLMRRHQVEYFKSKGGLETCKELERRVDREVKAILNPQSNLFKK